MSEHDDLCESIAVDIGVGEMHRPCSCDKRRIERLRADLAAANTALGAWHSVFGTTQLSHAQARLESAEQKLAAALRERDEAMKDAGRLDWVLENCMLTASIREDAPYLYTREQIDAARAQGGSDE